MEIGKLLALNEVARALEDVSLVPTERDFEQVAAAHPFIAAMRARLKQRWEYGLVPANIYVFGGFDIVTPPVAISPNIKVAPTRRNGDN